jgi:hypothetical protein
MVGDHPRRGRETTWPNPRSIFVLASFVAATLLAGGANAQSTAPGTPAADGAVEKAIAEAGARADRLLEQGPAPWWPASGGRPTRRPTT